MHEQIIYLIGNAFRVYIYWKLLNTLFHSTKVKNIWIVIGFIGFFLVNSIAAIAFCNFTLDIYGKLWYSKIKSVRNVFGDGYVKTNCIVPAAVQG